MASSDNIIKDAGAPSAFIPGVRIGDRFAGAYEIVRLLGEGGMGSVFLARDLRCGGREVALKIRHPPKGVHGQKTCVDDASIGSLGAQSAEARFLASCEHPSILPVFDVGIDQATGLSFFTMPAYLLGEDEMRRLCDDIMKCPYPRAWARWKEGPSALTLRDLLRGGKALPEASVARIGIDIVTALAYTHTHKPPLVHRDIKPSNILFDGTGRAMLADFGIARELRAPDLDAPGGHAKAGARGFAGTFDYASPEQKSGADATPASDYYSLGIILHEALTGERIYGSTAPSAFDPSSISSRWNGLLARLLDDDPARRLADPEETLRALRAILRESSTRGSRRMMIAAAVAAAAVAAAATLALPAKVDGTLAGSPPEAAEADAAPLPQPTVEELAAEVEEKVEFLRCGMIWPDPSPSWFSSLVFPPRPENNRRFFGGTVFEMLLPNGTPMQFVSMAFGGEPKYIEYFHGYFEDEQGMPNMDAGARKAARTVVSKRLLFSRTEVTRQQFDAVMSATNAVPLRETRFADWTNSPTAMASIGMGPREFNSRVRYILEHPNNWPSCTTSVFIKISAAVQPVPGVPAAEGIRFADVERFIAKLNSLCPRGCVFRLPTEAEWEGMCRMDNMRRFEDFAPDDICWSRENSGGKPHPVAQKGRGVLGVYDMHGNVAEWCQDGFGPIVRPAFDPLIPVPPDGSHVVRGGSWAEPFEECGSECRRAAGPDETGIGIRLVLEY